MEICRLSPEQLARLQNHEKSERILRGYNQQTNDFSEILERKKRCLNPWEIQECFGLCSLKEHYGIPADHLASQDAHNQRLRSEFRLSGLIPDRGDFSIFDVDTIHRFDEVIVEEINSNSKTKIN